MKPDHNFEVKSSDEKHKLSLMFIKPDNNFEVKSSDEKH